MSPSGSLSGEKSIHVFTLTRQQLSSSIVLSSLNTACRMFVSVTISSYLMRRFVSLSLCARPPSSLGDIDPQKASGFKSSV